MDISRLIEKVSEKKVSLNDVAEKTLKDYLLSLEVEGKLSNGMLNLEDMDDSERSEVLLLAKQFDKTLIDSLINSAGFGTSS